MEIQRLLSVVLLLTLSSVSCTDTPSSEKRISSEIASTDESSTKSVQPSETVNESDSSLSDRTKDDEGIDDKSRIKKILDGARKTSKALIEGKFETVVEYTFPKAVQIIGGREKMIDMLETGSKQMKSQGIQIRSV